VIAEGVLVVQRMLASRFRTRAMLGTDRRLGETRGRIWAASRRRTYRVDADVMAEVVGFHLNRGVLASASRPPERTVAQVLEGARTVAVVEGVNDHENLASIFRNAAGLGVDAGGVRHRLRPTRCTGAPFACRWPRAAGPVRMDRGLAERPGVAARERVSSASDDPATPPARALADAMTEVADERWRSSSARKGPG